MPIVPEEQLLPEKFVRKTSEGIDAGKELQVHCLTIWGPGYDVALPGDKRRERPIGREDTIKNNALETFPSQGKRV
jgi:hypothetical protein